MRPAKRAGLRQWRLRLANGSTLTTFAATHADALENGRRVGFRDPVSCGLMDPDPEETRRRAIAAWLTK